MSNQMDFIKFKDELQLSTCFGDQYRELLGDSHNAFTSSLYGEVEEIYNYIIRVYDALTAFQISILRHLTEVFNNIRSTIDPNRLKEFSHGINEDGDLILYRTSGYGLTNLIIHEEEDFAYSFIGTSHGRELEFYDEEADFEKIALKFFSN